MVYLHLKTEVIDAVRGELVEPSTALRQAQGERNKFCFRTNEPLAKFVEWCDFPLQDVCEWM